MLNEEELRDAALLVFANKQDQPGAKGAGDISEALRLGELKDRNWTIVACSAIDGRGVSEGMDWMVVSLLAAPDPAVTKTFLTGTNSLDSKPCNKNPRNTTISPERTADPSKNSDHAHPSHHRSPTPLQCSSVHYVEFKSSSMIPCNYALSSNHLNGLFAPPTSPLGSSQRYCSSIRITTHTLPMSQ